MKITFPPQLFSAAVCLVIGIATVLNTRGATIEMDESNATTSENWDTPEAWSDDAAPSDANDYVVGIISGTTPASSWTSGACLISSMIGRPTVR